jgi:hypothetical protein
MNIRKWSYAAVGPLAGSAGAAPPSSSEAVTAPGSDVHGTGPEEPAPGPEPTTSAPSSGQELKTLRHQVRELSQLVDGAIEDLEQVLRAFKMIERNL